jgi:GxxExxY protein
MSNLLHEELTNKIIKSYYNVYNYYGYGFNEKLYRNSLSVELSLNGLNVEVEKKIVIFYKNRLVGEFYADLLVEDTVLLEIKAHEYLIKNHEIQLLNYLKSSKYEIGLLMNFGRPEFKRCIYTNNVKLK